MSYEFNENKLIEIFVTVDDFCQQAEHWAEEHEIFYAHSDQAQLHISEILTILIFYHHSGFKCFEYYYERMVLDNLSSYFPKAVSYKRFLSLIPKCFNHLYLLCRVRAKQAQRTGTYFVDSKKLPVCHNRRIHSNKVFKGIAKRGKSSTGWFYGFKIHLVINELGEIVNFMITTGNVQDNNPEVLTHLFDQLQGHCFGDKGYITKLFEQLYAKGLKVVTKIRSNMKNKLMDLTDRLWLLKRAVIESVNDILMTVCDVDHTRHRSPINALCHLLGGLIAYGFLDQKPSVNLPNWLNP
jgi:hypothetical protein